MRSRSSKSAQGVSLTPLVLLLWLLASGPAAAQSARWLAVGEAARPETLAISDNAQSVALSPVGAPGELRLLDLHRGVTRRLSPPSPEGAPIEDVAWAKSGQQLVFSTGRDDLLPRPPEVCRPPGHDCNGAVDVFHLDRIRYRFERLSLTCFGEESVGGCSELASNGDATRVAMVCTASDLVPNDSNGQTDVFLRDDWSDWTYRVSLAQTGAQADGPSGTPVVDDPLAASVAINQRGNVVVFVSAASNLVRGDENGVPDVFVHNVFTARTTRVSVTPEGGDLDGPSGLSGVGMSGDGRWIVFGSTASNLVDEPVGTGERVYLHDRQTGITQLVSRRAGGCLDDGDSSSPAISGDGLAISFLSSDPCLDVVTPPDVENEPHLFVWRRFSDALLLADRSLNGGPAEAPVLTYRLAGNGDWALVQSEATDLDGAVEGDGPWLFLVPTVEDRDGDGLPDDWESDGLDVDGDGTLDLDLPALGANPDRRDLFLEYDFLRSDSYDHTLSPAVIEWLETAFTEAPLENPDGSTGIDLRIDVEAVEAVPWSGAHQRIALSELDEIRADWYGSPSQREDPNWANIRAARTLVYRYGFIGHLQQSGSSSGIAELPGDDFLMTLGAFDGGIGTLGQQAGTFLHELGHTLGLFHGGGDIVNCKPNYLSVMSYSFQFPETLPERPLDFSRWRLRDLDENALDEEAGLDAPAGWQTVHGPALFDPFRGFTPIVTDADGPVDWDLDGGIDEAPVERNINDIGYVCPSGPGEYLASYADWEHLVFNARGAAQFQPGVHLSVARDELDADDLAELRRLSPWGDNAAPVAVIAPLGAALEDTSVPLDGTGSFDPEGGYLVARWDQVSGPLVDFDDPARLDPTVGLPGLDEDAEVRLTLAVFDGVFWSVPAFVTLPVVADGRTGSLDPGGSVEPAAVDGLGRDVPLEGRQSGPPVEWPVIEATPRERVGGEPSGRDDGEGCGVAPGASGSGSGLLWVLGVLWWRRPRLRLRSGGCERGGGGLCRGPALQPPRGSGPRPSR